MSPCVGPNSNSGFLCLVCLTLWISLLSNQKIGKSDKTAELFVHRLWYLITQKNGKSDKTAELFVHKLWYLISDEQWILVATVWSGRMNHDTLKWGVASW
jgi:hypothetical protein